MYLLRNLLELLIHFNFDFDFFKLILHMGVASAGTGAVPAAAVCSIIVQNILFDKNYSQA